MRILVVDHAADRRILLKALLNTAGHLDLDEVTTGERTLTRLQDGEDDGELVGAVVISQQLPGISGVDVAAGLDDRLHIPIILVVDEEDDKTLNAAADAGVLSVLRRPVRPANLRLAIEGAFRFVRSIHEAALHSSDLEAARITEAHLRSINEELRVARDLALEASRWKTAFLTNVGHELRTPLNAIIGYSEMLIEEAEGHSWKDDLQRVRSAGLSLRHLINDILELSRMEAGRAELQFDEFVVDDLVSELTDSARPVFEKSGNLLDFEAEGELGTMHADASRVRQIVWNVLSNACKFTKKGEVFFRVRPYADDTFVEFEISDTGIGMTEQEVERLFDTFFQADMSSTRQFGGTGLGMAISRRFCRLMGGDIDVESEKNRGTTFWVRIPRDVPAHVARG